MLERRGWDQPPRLWTLRATKAGIVAKPSEVPPSEWTRLGPGLASVQVLAVFARDYDSHNFHTESQYVGWAWSMESGNGPEVDGRETRIVCGMLRSGEGVMIVRMKGDALAESVVIDIPDGEQGADGLFRSLRLLCGLERAQA